MRRLTLRFVDWTLKICGCLALLAFFSGLLFGGWGGKMNLSCMRNACLPLSDPQDIVAMQERIFVALAFYGRIQVYDQQGAFLFGFFVRTGGGGIRLSLDKDKNIVVIPVRGHQAHLYDRDGTLISSIEKKTTENLFQTDRKRGYFIDGQGHEYAIRNRFFGATISQSDATGKALMTISTPLLLQPLAGPLPCWAMMIFAALGQMLIRRRLARYSKTSEKIADGVAGAQDSRRV